MRKSRLDYCKTSLMLGCVLLVGASALFTLEGMPRFFWSPWALAALIGALGIPWVAANSERLHDIGWSGWMQLVWLTLTLWLGGSAYVFWTAGQVPLSVVTASAATGPFLHMVYNLFLREGDRCINRYGAPPR